MKVITLALAFLLSGTSFTTLGQSDKYMRLWSNVYRFELKDLPKSALKVVDSIYHKAKREGNIEQLTKALIYQSKFALVLEENAELLIVAKLKKEILDSKPPQSNILESILAQIYWQYFQNNRQAFYGRTRLAEHDRSGDFRTWDLNTILQEIHRHFQKSLRNAESLQNTELTSLDEILIKAESSKTLRPTVYDFLAHNALTYYQANEGTSIDSETKTEQDQGLFDDFDNYQLPANDSLSSRFQSLKIYRSLLTFHRQKHDTSAYINLELERLQYLSEELNQEDDRTTHKRALVKLKAIYGAHPASSLIDFQLATLLYQEGSEYSSGKTPSAQYRKKEALTLLVQALDKFPLGLGAEKCRTLKEQILTPTLSLLVERYVPVDRPALLQVKYRNIPGLSFGAYLVTEEFERRFQIIPDTAKIAELENIKPIASWSAEFKSLGDYQEHSTEVAVPALPGGSYLLIAKIPNDTTRDRVFAHALVSVTNLSLLETNLPKSHRFQIVERQTGKPIYGAKVQVHSSKETSGNTEYINQFTTDKNGFFEIEKSATTYTNLIVNVDWNGDRAAFKNIYLSYWMKDREDLADRRYYTAKSFLFTDRSIYRPGQTVYFKGILVKLQGKKSSVVTGEYVEVFLQDVNYEEVASLRLKTNSFGSFSGEFKLPTSGLTGEYTLYADEDSESSNFYDDLLDYQYSEVGISVEEYKRPTFEVSFEKIKDSFKLNDTIKIAGSAMSFSGASISRAKVNYRVRRSARYPSWHHWNTEEYYANEKEIAFGSVLANEKGQFTIPFKAVPDELIPQEERPTFHFEVFVDVTDITGETRSATCSIKVGYHSLAVTLQAPNAINRNGSETTLSITSENLNGQYLPSKGSVRIYKLTSPTQALRSRPWEAPDLPIMSEQEFKGLFPHDAYANESDPNKWKKGKLLFETNYNTEQSASLKFIVGKNWELGSYIIELNTSDPNGLPVNSEHRFSVYETGNKSIADQQLLVFESNQDRYKVGDLVKLKIGSASPDITVTLDVETEDRTAKTFVEHLEFGSKEIVIPVTEAMANGFTIHSTAVNFNSVLVKKKNVLVDVDEEDLEIESITFKDKLQPGSKQTWSFILKGRESNGLEAEMLASMYDASLDQFKPHQWTFRPIPKETYNSNRFTNTYHSFGDAAFEVINLPYSYYSIPRQYYDQLDWFGFTLSKNEYAQRRYMARFYSSGPDLDNPSVVTILNDKSKVEGFIYGTLTDHEGQPIPGANVIIKGTTLGTVTDMDGNYQIAASKGDILVFSFIGYSTAEAKVGRKNTINVVMNEDVKALSEVVVTAQGIQKTVHALGYAVTTVTADTLFQEVAFERMLQGRVAGVEITGLTGGAARLAIRGLTNADGTEEPLYIVDGVVVTTTKIDKNDIANIEVLKGAEAVSIYGSRASNGVIIVTTKSGQKKLDEELARLTTRKNFNETAFFFPHLSTDENGKVRFTFTTPESLTRWKLQLLAHTKDLATSSKVLQAITQKELMVSPNAPRFLRVGDEIVFTAKVTNLATKAKEGKVALQLFNAVKGGSVDQQFHNITKNQSFKVAPKSSAEIMWKLHVPVGIDAIEYKLVAKAGNFTDGEQNIIPVLSNKLLVTESLPLYVSSGQIKTFRINKLANNPSTSRQNHQLVLEITSNPAWYAIQALPYLMEFPHECAEQIFSRFYANAMASHIINKHPKFKEIFDQWASSNAPTSKLETNKELKSLLIEETPWLRDAQDESEQKKRIALLFDMATLAQQQARALEQLSSMQLDNGGFPWFAGGSYSSRYITQHVASGFGHLLKLNVLAKEPSSTMINKAITFLDDQLLEDYHRLKFQASEIRLKAKSQEEGERLATDFMSRKQVDNTQVQYLYMRSFFPTLAVSEKLAEATNYYINQTETYWKDLNLYGKGMTALVHHRAGRSALSREIIRSLKENSIVSEELGMYWKENIAGWYWFESPIETQALLIEAFQEIQATDNTLTEDEKLKTLDELRIWLLKNKQTNRWKTTKATTEAIYALLLMGSDWTPVENQTTVKVGGKTVDIAVNTPEAGTGYFKRTWPGETVTKEMAEVSLEQTGKGVAWGGLYWQYFEDVDKITTAQTSLQLEKRVFQVSQSQQGEVLTELDSVQAISTGDKLRIRIVLRTDRNLEFIHLKDMRASGLEPIDVLSEYKWQEGLGYYQSTKDAATHFFFDSLPKGQYVFEYDLRANNKGEYSNGIATIQSMYAPEFTSHSRSVRLKIR